MRNLAIAALLATTPLIGCKNEPTARTGAANAATPAAAAPTAAPSAPVGTQPPAAGALAGVIAEKIDASEYSYLKIKTDAGEAWAAVPKTTKAVGAKVSISSPMWMPNFSSATLNRTWDKIAFGTLDDEAGAGRTGMGAMGGAAGGGEGAMPAGHPPMGGAAGNPGAGMFAREAAQMPAGQQAVKDAMAAKAPPPHGAVPAAGGIKVAKASGADGRTVAEVWGQKATLKDKTVQVRGKIVKKTEGVLGKNWLHVQDGSGSGQTADLIIASTETAGVGDVVLVTGKVQLDKDLGAGYRYDVLLEDAKLKKE